MSYFVTDSSMISYAIYLAMVARRSHGELTRRMLPAERHAVCDLRNTPYGIISDLSIEYGHADVKIAKVNSNVDRLFAGLGDGISVFMSHFDKLVSLPKVSEVSSYLKSAVIDSNRVLWLSLLLRTQSTLA